MGGEKPSFGGAWAENVRSEEERRFGAPRSLPRAVLLGPRHAWPQYVPDYFPTGVPGYNQEMGVTVVTRVRPLYTEPGVRLGGFLFYPRLTQSLGYNSNVAGTHEGPGSWLVETNPSLQVQSDWSRNSLGASVSLDNFRYPNTGHAELHELADGDRRRLHDRPGRPGFRLWPLLLERASRPTSVLPRPPRRSLIPSMICAATIPSIWER